jgi:hypothetical protein
LPDVDARANQSSGTRIAAALVGLVDCLRVEPPRLTRRPSGRVPISAILLPTLRIFRSIARRRLNRCLWWQRYAYHHPISSISPQTICKSCLRRRLGQRPRRLPMPTLSPPMLPRSQSGMTVALAQGALSQAVPSQITPQGTISLSRSHLTEESRSLGRFGPCTLCCSRNTATPEVHPRSVSFTCPCSG